MENTTKVVSSSSETSEAQEYIDLSTESRGKGETGFFTIKSASKTVSFQVGAGERGASSQGFSSIGGGEVVWKKVFLSNFLYRKGGIGVVLKTPIANKMGHGLWGGGGGWGCGGWGGGGGGRGALFGRGRGGGVGGVGFGGGITIVGSGGGVGWVGGLVYFSGRGGGGVGWGGGVWGGWGGVGGGGGGGGLWVTTNIFFKEVVKRVDTIKKRVWGVYFCLGSLKGKGRKKKSTRHFVGSGGSYRRAIKGPCS